ncbi:MAG: hypothetical protein AAFU77_05340 [Myxococcota bacterium]
MWKTRLAVVVVAVGFAVGGLWLALPYLAPWMSPASDWEPVPIAGVQTECFAEDGWAFCLHRTANSDPKRLLVHLHGRRGNERWWNDEEYYTGELYGHWERLGVSPPTVASISFGPLWLLKKSEGIKHFVSSVIPAVKKRLAAPDVELSVIGESMGGLNALMLTAFAGEHLDRTAVLCAPIPTSSPYALGASLSSAAESSVSFARAFMLLSFGRYFFRDHDDFVANDPLSGLAQGSLPRVYVTCGETDDWGCMPGSRSAVTRMKERGAEVEWHPRPGGHCDIDSESLARFLAR